LRCFGTAYGKENGHEIWNLECEESVCLFSEESSARIIHLAQDKDQWRALVDAVMNLRVLQKTGNGVLSEKLKMHEEYIIL
jgi:hypothetical protein